MAREVIARPPLPLPRGARRGVACAGPEPFTPMRRFPFLPLAVLALVAPVLLPAQRLQYPPTRTGDVVDDYHGCLVISVRQGRTLYREIEGLWRGIAGAVSSIGPGSSSWQDNRFWFCERRFESFSGSHR